MEVALTTVQAEFKRLSRIYERLGVQIKTAPGASEARLASIAALTGIELDEPLQDLWRISNGSRRYAWFADGDDEDFTPHSFLSIRDATALWRLFAPYDEKLYSEWYDDESWGKRDPRIQRHFLRHSKWLGFAHFNGGSELLQFDADPTAKGKPGQVILYSHDPDGVFWRASSFLSFFKKSNDLLEELAEEPEVLIEKLWLAKSEDSGRPGLLQPDTCHIVEFDFDGIRVTWPATTVESAARIETRRNPSKPLENCYGVLDGPFALEIDRGVLTFEDDGLVFEYGAISPGDHIRVAGYNRIFVNDELRYPEPP